MKFIEKLTKFKDDNQGMSQVVDIVLSLMLIIVVGSIGIFIADRTNTAVNLNPNMMNASDTANRTANANLTAMYSNFYASGQTGSSFVVILIIAFIGGVAIAYLMGMLKGGRRNL